MKILTIGAGIIGTIYGWALSEAGNEVTHLVRRGRAARLTAGIPVDMLDSRKGRQKKLRGRYDLRVTETIDTAQAFDLVIVPTKPYQLEAALKEIVPRSGHTSFLLLTQNWNGTADIDDILPQSRYLYGDAKAGGVFVDGTLVAALFPTIDLGGVDAAREEMRDGIGGVFESAGIRPTFHDNILHYIWVQYAINAGLWPALVRAGGLANLLRDRRLGELSLQAVKECLDVVASRGVELGKYPDTRMFYKTSFLARRIAGLMITLMFRFNESVRRTSAHALGDPLEIKTAFYDLLATGRDLRVLMPVMESFEGDVLRFASAGAA